MTHTKAFTLIETLIYIAILALVLPAISLFMVNTISRQHQITARIDIEENSAMILDELRYELQHAQSIQISTSTFNTTSSVLRFTDRAGIATSILVVNDTYTGEGQSRIIRRLQSTRSGVTQWLTDNNVAISSFFINPVRDTSGDLTGINMSITLEPHVMTTSEQQAEALTLSTSVWLPTYVQEL